MDKMEAVQVVIDTLYAKRDEQETGTDAYDYYNEILIAMLNLEMELIEE